MNYPRSTPGTLAPSVDLAGAIVVPCLPLFSTTHVPNASTTAEPARLGSQPKKPVTFDAWLQPQSPPPPGPHAVTANAVVEHSNGGVSASYRVFDDKGHEMAPEGGAPRENIYAPSQLDLSQPKDPAMFSIALGDVGTFPDGKHLLKRKVHNHLGEFMYPDGKRLRKHFPYARVTASVSADHERFNRGSRAYEGEGLPDDGDLSSPPTRTIDLPSDFTPLHPSLRPKRRIVVPCTPTHLEMSEPFFVTIMNMVGITPKVMERFCYSMYQGNPKLRDLWEPFKDMQSTSEGADGEPKSPSKVASDLIALLDFLVDCTQKTFPADYAPRACRHLEFSHAGDNFVFGRLRRQCTSSPDVVWIIDCAPVAVTRDEHSALTPPAPPSRLLAAAAKQFASGSLTHIFGMTHLGTRATFYYIDRCGTLCSTQLELHHKLYNLNKVDGMAQFMSTIISFCFMSDVDFGINALFKVADGGWPRKNLVGSLVVLNNDRGYVVEEVISCSRSLFGLGSALYSAREAASTLPSEEDGHPGKAHSTHTFKLQWHSRPWTSTQPLYHLAEASGVGNLAEVEEAVFGECIGDGFRWFAAKDLEERFAADARPRLLSMKPVCMPLSFVTDPGQFKAAFISLVRAHRDLYMKAGILHRDVSVYSMLVDASNPARGVIAGLDLAIHITVPPSWDQEEILPLGDATFQSIDLGRLPIGTPAPEQRYRYDLESFLFVLIWSVCKVTGVPYEERWHGMDVGQTVLSLVFGDDPEQDGPRPDEDVHEGETTQRERGAGEWRSDSDIQELKMRFILLDQYALDESYGGENSIVEEAANGGLAIRRRLNDRMHDRMLQSSLGRLPYGFGERWILRLQELFRDGYTARRLWCERKAAAASAAFSTGEHGYEKMQSAVLRLGEFDGDTLAGHVTYDKFMRILEKWNTIER